LSPPADAQALRLRNVPALPGKNIT